MCGIAGIFSSSFTPSYSEEQLMKMLTCITHRGPDSFGVKQVDGVHLGHRRLAIHDLTSAGHQPMTSQTGRFEVVFNGEIYNFNEIREQLPNTHWNGCSDTEVMLAAFEHFGIEQSLSLFNGMFAFAVWDRKDSTLILARDKFGEKPLYYYHERGTFVFASELTSIEVLDDVKLTIDRNAVCRQLQCSYIPAPLTIYKEARKLPPGNMITVKLGDEMKVKPYWTLSEEIKRSKNDIITCENEAIELLEQELLRSVKLRMAADVPLGAFLSGGIDSSLVTSLMQAQCSKPVNTFSIGFNVDGYNEAEFAKQVANYLGTNHTEHYFDSNDVIELVPQISKVFDEPFSDPSQLPTLLVSKMAREKVTVCLSGDGGDELFSGYKRYEAIPDIWRKISRFPCRKTFAHIIKNTPTSLLSKLFFFLSPFASRYGRKGDVGQKLKVLANWLQAQDVNDLYNLSLQHWKHVNQVVLGSGHSDVWEPGCTVLEHEIERMMYQDSIAYLPGDILTKVDRTAMSVSLEGRIPLLDPNVASIAWRLPIHMKQRGDVGKWALRQVLYKYVPQNIMERPKMGFGVPMSVWLRNELKPWMLDVLDFDKLRQQELLNVDMLEVSIKKHLTGSENNAAQIWDVLMLQSWLDESSKRSKRL
ncbi:asparagine synthase (glutamine-hydrolyzing) [Vibrio tubiashii]|uniref:asparagine synthase (glutamine-hydrolyzing) n=1 Tax=Vibrio tubiashii TaxID=29498 RepID=A0AAE5LJ47_9VIBR|nr:asparagine synthase (glutamine-hydrolyzing) [Vibrio tubiashii]NOI82323.1 asparagine synthase (glutamine-hydrolyzing) [Vibrio tubiashii]